MNVNGQTVLVIGGGDGIGAAGAHALAAAGANVVVADRNGMSAKAVAANITRRGYQATAVTCDATNPEHLERARIAVHDTYGPVDILWLHAGVSLAGPPERIPVSRWREVLDVNVLANVSGLQQFLPDMFERRMGHIVLTSSGLGLFPSDVAGLAAPYVVSKAAQIALARTMQPYLAQRGVTISVLVPDATNTRHTLEVNTYELDSALVTATIDQAALQTPEQVATALIDGLGAGTFLISTVPNTGSRLLEDAARGLAAPTGASGIVAQSVQLTLDPSGHDDAASVLSAAATDTASEPGCVTYRVTADLERRGVFHVFEEWASQQDLDRHATAPTTEKLVMAMGELGVTDVQVRKYEVADAYAASLG